MQVFAAREPSRGDFGSPLAVELAPECMEALERVIASGAIVGPRMHESSQRLLN